LCENLKIFHGDIKENERVWFFSQHGVQQMLFIKRFQWQTHIHTEADEFKIKVRKSRKTVRVLNYMYTH